MCGIAGIVRLDPRERVEPVRLRRMHDMLRHRGPDGEGLHLEGPAGLAHRRLAIVDPARGAQPMASGDGSLWIAFNGEIYNHPSLRLELESEGHEYRTRSDTESILHLYERDGERCVERLRGMFAFALWDAPRGRLLLARDRLGIKPLYYAITPEEIVFASEIKAILAALPSPPAIHRAILPEFLATRFVSGEETFFSGVSKLLPGRTLSWSREEGFRRRRYWAPPARSTVTEAPAAEIAAEVRSRLAESVRGHLMSDVPLGVFLSGGVDSAGVAALAAKMVDGPIRTFSVGFDDPAANELAWARLASRAVGSDHHEVIVSPGSFWSALPRLVWHEDEPIAFTSSVPLYFLSRLAGEKVKVVLTGEGADELFLGYRRYRMAAWNESLGGLWWGRALPSLGPLARSLPGRLPRRLRRYAERSFLARPPRPREIYFDNFAVFTVAAQEGLLQDADLLAGRDPYASSLECCLEAPAGSLESMSHADLQTYLVELLMKQDQMSMAASVESRVPFLDHEFVDYAAALPARLKLRGGRTKAILKDALRDLVPREILSRRKMGFPVPVGRWLRGPFRHVVDEYVLSARARRRDLFDHDGLLALAEEHRAGAVDHGERLWLLINLEIWQRIFLDGEDPASMEIAGHA